MENFLLRAFGADRPGIVYRITNELAKLEANLSDSTMTDLEGQFVIMLSFTCAAGVSSNFIEAKLKDGLSDLSLNIEVSSIEFHDRVLFSDDESKRVSIRVYGADRPGIVAGFTKVLYDFGINITDLKTSITGSESSPNYFLLIVADTPNDVDTVLLENELKTASTTLGVHMSLDVIAPDTI